MPVPPLRHAVLLAALLSPALAAAQKPPAAKPLPPAAPSSPDPQATARGLAQEGLKLYGADRYAEALASFREADTLFHAPSVTLYIARCHRKMGKLLTARATYDQLLAEPLPKDASPQFIQAHVEAGQELEALKHHIPTVRVTVAGVPVSDVSVTLDGTPLDGAREVDPGSHTLEIRRRAPAAPIVQTVTLAEGDHPTLPFDFGPAKATGIWWLPGVVTAGVGVIGLGIGAATGALTLSKASSIKSQCTLPGGACPNHLRGDYDSAVTLGNVSTATLAIGGAAVATGGLLLYLFRPQRQGPEQQPGAQVRVGLGRIDVEGSF